MNETEFAKHIMELIKNNKKLSKWYEKKMAHQGFDKTVETLMKGLYESDGPTIEEAIVLSLFIGLSSNLVMSTKKLIEESGIRGL